MFLSSKNLTWRPIWVFHRVFELLDVSEPEPDDAGHDDDDQREDLGRREEVLDQGGRLHLPAVDERQETLIWDQ